MTEELKEFAIKVVSMMKAQSEYQALLRGYADRVVSRHKVMDAEAKAKNAEVKVKIMLDKIL